MSRILSKNGAKEDFNYAGLNEHRVIELEPKLFSLNLKKRDKNDIDGCFSKSVPNYIGARSCDSHSHTPGFSKRARTIAFCEDVNNDEKNDSRSNTGIYVSLFDNKIQDGDQTIPNDSSVSDDDSNVDHYRDGEVRRCFIDKPNINDIFCFHSSIPNTNCSNRYKGNEQFFRVIEKWKHAYALSGGEDQKKLIAWSVVNEIRHTKPSGRFLLASPRKEKINTSDEEEIYGDDYIIHSFDWYAIGWEAALKKTEEALKLQPLLGSIEKTKKTPRDDDAKFQVDESDVKKGNKKQNIEKTKNSSSDQETKSPETETGTETAKTLREDDDDDDDYYDDDDDDDDDEIQSDKPDVTKGHKKQNRWSALEDKKLLAFLRSYGENWSFISLGMPGRTNKQCYTRYVNHLSPYINRSHWTAEEDKILINGNIKHGNNWSLIAKELTGRPVLSIKNRWYTSLRMVQNRSEEIEHMSRSSVHQKIAYLRKVNL